MTNNQMEPDVNLKTMYGQKCEK